MQKNQRPKPHPALSPNRASAASKSLRSDGVEARRRLLMAALPLFAAKGFAKTSTREIARAAGVNLASIAYYFGDKAGLYHAAYNEPLGCDAEGMGAFTRPGLSLQAALAEFLKGFTEPLKQGALAQQMLRLHFREMLEPTGLWQEHIDHFIAPTHQGLIDLLQRHLPLSEDDDLHRLVICLSALGVHLHQQFHHARRQHADDGRREHPRAGAPGGGAATAGERPAGPGGRGRAGGTQRQHPE